MTTETDQTAGQLDEATVLRVLEMLNELRRDEDAGAEAAHECGDWLNAAKMGGSAAGLSLASSRLVALYRASLGLEEA